MGIHNLTLHKMKQVSKTMRRCTVNAVCVRRHGRTEQHSWQSPAALSSAAPAHVAGRRDGVWGTGAAYELVCVSHSAAGFLLHSACVDLGTHRGSQAATWLP